MKVDRANQSTVFPRQSLILAAGLAVSVLIPACERAPLQVTDAQVRANLTTVRSWPGSPLPEGAARFRAADGRLEPEFADQSESATARVALPDKANGQAHVEDRATGLAVDITLVGAKTTTAHVVDGYVVYPNGHALGWVYQRAEPSGVEDYVVLDQRPASPRIAYQVKLGSHVTGLRLVENQLEILDASGTPRLRLAPPYVVGRDGARTDALLAVEGCPVDTNPAGPWGRAVKPSGPRNCRVVVSWANDGVSYPAVLDPRWQTTGSLAVARQDHNLVYLPLTGKVLAVGGRSSPTSTTGLTSAELYDNNSRTWSATSSMNGGRWSASATLLGASANGTTSQKVLIAGGINGTASVNTAQLYNQTAGTWAAAGTMNAARHLHTATLLNDGRVLVCGGMNGNTILTSAALYNPASGSGSWTATTGPIPPPGWRSGTATLIKTSNNQLNNKVLLAGGNNGTNTISAVFLFDPAQSAFSTLASMPSSREGHQAVALSDGRILFAGGKNGSTRLASAVIFDPSWGPGNWYATGSMTSPRWGHAMNLLPSGVLTQGLVLVSGGSNGTSTLSSTEYWNGINWAIDGAMVAPVQQHASVALGSSILVAGGAINNGSTTVSAAEVYDPSIGLGCTLGSQCASGFCVAGVCCDSACNDGCGACNLPGHLGTCTPLENGSICRPRAGDCDMAETCDGSSLACPADTLESSTTICRESGGSCDVAESCTGTSATCPDDILEPATTECRPSAGDCDVAENCTGTSAPCPDDLVEPDGTECDDDDACTEKDACHAGGCTGLQKTCEPPNTQCYGPSTCTDGLCIYTQMDLGTACDDGKECTSNDRCDANGVCSGDSTCNSPPNTQCFETTGTCENTGCSYKQETLGAACDDDDENTREDWCHSAGTCLGASLEGRIVPHDENDTVQSELPGTFGVSQVGAATYSIPLEIPEGRAGVTPRLALNYNSQGGDGILGIGWSISGAMSQIAPCKKTVALDGEAEAPTYSQTCVSGQLFARYCLDGEPLVRRGSEMSCASIEFHPERDPSTLVTMKRGPSQIESFLVQRADGVKMYYETLAIVDRHAVTANHENFDPTSSFTVPTAGAYLLSRVTDLTGNTMYMRYDVTSTDVLPQDIRYTGYVKNGVTTTLPLRRVDFEYVNRPDASDAWANGVRTTSDRLLKRIKVYGPTPLLQPVLLFYYEMAYRNDSVTGRSLLHSVKECTADNLCKPETSFDWERGVSTFTNVGSIAYAPIYEGVKAIDINGDGRIDRVTVQSSGDATGKTVNFGLARSTCVNPINHFCGWDSSDAHITGVQSIAAITPIDIDGDGGSELIVRRTENGKEWLRYYRFDGSKWDLIADDGNEVEVPPGPLYIYVTDMDGDGLPEVVRSVGGYWKYRRSNGTALGPYMFVGPPDDDGDTKKMPSTMAFNTFVALLIEKVASLPGNRRHHWDGVLA